MDNVLDFEKAQLKRDLAALELELEDYDSELWKGYDEFCLKSLEEEFSAIWEVPKK